jgi:protein phosphatase-4 regulatory subunit 3
LRINNHFIHRYYTKNDLLAPLIVLLEEEGGRDNMLSSSCMDVLDWIRKVSLFAGDEIGADIV